jgi:GNAT superfamily N-acetyltransferase
MIAERNGSPVDVRRAADGDAAPIAECLAELGYGTSARLVAARLQAWANSPDDAVFVAADASSGQVLGAASVHIIPLLHAPGGLARLTALAVRAVAHRRGVGRQLVAAAEAFARQAGCPRLEVTSGSERAPAHAFYRSLGYAERSRRFIKQLGAEPEVNP